MHDIRPPRLAHPLPIGEQNWPEGTRPLVSILCPTYNHERFIAACLEGFLLQETTFPVEIIVQDDASTDGTADIVRTYTRRHPQLFRPVFHETNQYSRGRKPTLLAFRHSHGDYIATCEGDDFWCLPAKLERQIAIFDSNPECILCGGRVYVQRDGQDHPHKIEPSLAPETLPTVGPLEMLRGQWWMRTLSRVARRSVWEGYVRCVGDDPAACDFLFSLYCISRSGMRQQAFACLNEIVGTYREHPGGVWHGAGEDAKLGSDLAVLLFALGHFDFGDGREFLESSFLSLACRLVLTPDMNPSAYALYRQLQVKSRSRSIPGRLRNLLHRLGLPSGLS